MKDTVPSNTAMDDLIGLRVAVYTNAADNNHVDEGVLVAYDFPWLRILKSKNETLCLSVFNVRIVKLLEPWAKPPESKTLLRPAE